MPVLLLSAAQAGATSPAALAGTVVQAVAECLAGLAYVNAVKPGAVAIWGPWPFVSDLRTGAMSGGSGEQALITAACAQMGHFYKLTVGSAAGMGDSKLPDVQAGYEKGVTAALAAMTGIAPACSIRFNSPHVRNGSGSIGDYDESTDIDRDRRRCGRFSRA